ncbi:MAG: hypothetical protein JW925_00330 [Syntrophaceae bacterium]|nr:hypothetical protein [Syntrophaceae bacterium]
METRYIKFKKEVEILLKKSPLNIQAIYVEIQKKYPNECDDSESCEHKGHFYQYGEWKHLVRNALQGLKKEKIVFRDPVKGIWVHT